MTDTEPVTLEAAFGGLIDDLARAAREHNIAVSIHLTPLDEEPTEETKVRTLRDGEGDIWYETEAGSGLFGITKDDPHAWTIERIERAYGKTEPA